MDDPDASSGGTNPDVLLTADGHDWAIAVKTVHGVPSQTIFENVTGTARQIERVGRDGLIFVKLKNRIDCTALIPSDAVYGSPSHAVRALSGSVDQIIQKLRTEIVDAGWLEAFSGQKARPIVTFMSQTVVSAMIRVQNPMFVPIKAFRPLPVPPCPPNEMEGIDAEAWACCANRTTSFNGIPCPLRPPKHRE